jgi:hypothetical protein
MMEWNAQNKITKSSSQVVHNGHPVIHMEFPADHVDRADLIIEITVNEASPPLLVLWVGLREGSPTSTQSHLIVKSSLNNSYNLVWLDSLNPVNQPVFVCYSPRPIAGQVAF